MDGVGGTRHWGEKISSSFRSKMPSGVKKYDNMTDSMTLSTDTDGTTETDNTWQKPTVLWHISRTEISTSPNLKMGQGVPNT